MSHDQVPPFDPLGEDPALQAFLDSALGTPPIPPGMVDRVAARSGAVWREQRAIDRAMEARVSDALGVERAVPAGLTDRVYAASVADLPRPMRFVAPSRRDRRAWVSRLAMAASFALVATVGWWTTVGPPSGDGATRMAGSIRADAFLVNDVHSSVLDDLDAMRAADAQLIHAYEHVYTASFDELRDEIHAILPARSDDAPAY